MVCVRYPPAQWACRVPALGPCWGQELYLEEARGCHYWHCLALPQRLRWDGGAEVSHKTVSKRPNAALGFIPAAPALIPGRHGDRNTALCTAYERIETWALLLSSGESRTHSDRGRPSRWPLLSGLPYHVEGLRQALAVSPEQTKPL
jgi:hypothetical protein